MSAQTATGPVLRKARMDDVAHIYELLIICSGEGRMLPRSRAQLYSHLRDFFVITEADGQFMGCAALSMLWDNLAEIRSLALTPQARGRGYGRQLVEACCDEAQNMRVFKVFALTYQVAFFHKLGFGTVDKSTLPHKVWTDCVNCAKFPDCDETAVVKDLSA